MKLAQAFAPARGDVVAIIGAGGKTSLLIGLGYELAAAGWRVLATTTTQLAVEQLALFPRALPASANAKAISQALTEDSFVFLHDEIRQGRVGGPPLDWTRDLLDRVDSDILLVEADDAAGLPFKAPRTGEPRIPPETSLVIAMASLSALGKPLDAEHIYNPAAMIDRFGFARNSPVKSPWLAQVLSDGALGLRGVPESARVLIYLNQTPLHAYAQGRARLIARLCLQSNRISAVAFGSVRGAEPVSEVQQPLGALVLAGHQGAIAMDGEVAAPRGGEAQARNISRIAEQLYRSRIDHIRIVTGAGARQVRAAVKHLGIRTAHDRGYRSAGILSALKTGLRAMPANISAFLLLWGGQALRGKAIHQVMTAHARAEGDFIIPRLGGLSCCPILISRSLMQEMTKMRRGSTWLDIIERFADDITLLDQETGEIVPPPSQAGEKRELRLPWQL